MTTNGDRDSRNLANPFPLLSSFYFFAFDPYTGSLNGGAFKRLIPIF